MNFIQGKDFTDAFQSISSKVGCEGLLDLPVERLLYSLFGNKVNPDVFDVKEKI